MMKTNLIAICNLAILMLITGSAVNANQIVDLVDSADNQEPFPPGPNFFPGGATAGYLISLPDWGWTHTFSFEGPENPPPSIISATLEIRQFGVLATDQHLIKLDGVNVGILDTSSPTYPNGFPNELSHTTTFILGASLIANLMDGTANIWLDINYPNSVAIYWSRLTINYIPAGLDHIEVSGPIQVNEESAEQYTCTAHFINDGVSSSSNITNSAAWYDNSDFASIDSSGVLTTSSVLSDEACQIKAAFGGKTDTHDITIKNVMPTVSIPAMTYPAGEPHFIGVFEVRRTVATNETLRVYYSRSGSTATSGADYMDMLGYVDILPGETSTPVSVIVIDDAIEEATETVKLTLIADPSYIIDPDAFSAIVTIADDEEATIPEISGHKPEKDSIQVPRDTIIQVHVTDAGSGVEYDGGPITIHVEGNLIYDGANEIPVGVYSSAYGICRRIGTETDYTLVFQPSIPFDFEQKVDVVVNATDKTGYEITDTYSFYTLMKTFGKNIKVNSDAGKLAQNHPDSATDSLGNIWVVWEHAVIANDSDIYIGKLPEGESAFEPSQLVFGDLNNQLSPAIAIDGDDIIYVVWQGNDPSGFWDIFVSASVNGTDWSVPVKVNSNDPLNKSSQKSPAIGVDGNGK
ncbi:MAG: Calx-beta domain-containing protein, partial [Sedimentisphaerales bacterium]|nr:Calx-beta domain-containing protein [Sedimentisphaerales bacterium]